VQNKIKMLNWEIKEKENDHIFMNNLGMKGVRNVIFFLGGA
jgi:hypothetical protein